MKNTTFSSKLTHFFYLSALSAIFLLFSTFLFAQSGIPYYTSSLDGKDIRDVEVSTSGGSITVINSAGEKNRIEVYIKGNNNANLSNAEIENRLKEKYDFVIETSDNKVKVIAKRKSDWTDWKNALSISFKLYVPAKVNSKLKTSGGNITIKGLDGTQDFSTSGGSLSVANTNGNIMGRTSGGSITVNESEGKVQLKTSGGSITAEGCKGEIELATSGGSLRLNRLEGNIKATTSGGSVTGEGIGGELYTKTSGGSVRLAGIKGNIEAGTSGGSVNVEMLELGNYVKLKTSAGNIDLVIPQGKGVSLDLSGMKVNVPTLGNFSGSIDNNDLKGTLHGGGVQIYAKASAGKVNLTFK
jgi:DUF4097 and DUF4098 domain-containing protein YvlB